MSDWVEIVVPTGPGSPPGFTDEVAALIAIEVPAAAAGTEQRGDDIVFWVDAADVECAITQTRAAVARWRNWIASPGTAGARSTPDEGVRSWIDSPGTAGARSTPDEGVRSWIDPMRIHAATAAPETEWRDAWKRYFKVSRLTRQFVVVPSWEDFQPATNDIVIHLDPGLAFGTGTHASTRLVLEEIQQLADEGARPHRILDLGCGSGILAIAAAKCWPQATCVAMDVDPIAVAVTRDNASSNGVAERIIATTQPLTKTGDTFPLVVANIQADVLRELAPTLIAHTADTLVLSGLLSEQAAPLATEFEAAGLRLTRIRASAIDPQWSSVMLRVAK